MIYTSKRRRAGSPIGFAQLIAMTLSPICRAIERATIRMRLKNSQRAVEYLYRRLENDNRAIAAGYDSRELRMQIDQHGWDIKEEHEQQARLSMRLTELGQ